MGYDKRFSGVQGTNLASRALRFLLLLDLDDTSIFSDHINQINLVGRSKINANFGLRLHPPLYFLSRVLKALQPTYSNTSSPAIAVFALQVFGIIEILKKIFKSKKERQLI